MANNTFVIFDLETTGLNKEKDQIIQFSAVKIRNLEVIETLNLKICPDGDFKISIQAYMKHMITPDMLKDKPHLSEVADQIIDFIGDNDVITYNGTKFDIPFLVSALKKVGKHIDFLHRKCYDVYAEEKRRMPMHLVDVFKRYTGKTMEEAGYQAHDALGDSMATFDIFLKQLETGNIEPENMVCEDNVLVNTIFQGKEQTCFNVGQYKDLPVSYIASFPAGQSYLRWCVEEASFLDSTKNFIRQYIK